MWHKESLCQGKNIVKDLKWKTHKNKSPPTNKLKTTTTEKRNQNPFVSESCKITCCRNSAKHLRAKKNFFFKSDDIFRW